MVPRADWQLAARGRRWPWPRTLAFMAGLIAIDVALQSPVATFTGSYFEAHVTQHLLLMIIAPPLLAMGAPSTLLLQSSSRRVKTRWLAVLRSRAFAIATYPMLVWFFYFGAMFAFFLSPLINYAMEHMVLMNALNVGFLLGGCLYWWPIVGLDPIVHWRMGYGTRLAALSLGVPFEAFLGVAIMTLRTPIASMYSLNSTHSGGALLWAATELATFIGLIPVFVMWVRGTNLPRPGLTPRRTARRERKSGANCRWPSRFQPRSAGKSWFRARPPWSGSDPCSSRATAAGRRCGGPKPVSSRRLPARPAVVRVERSATRRATTIGTPNRARPRPPETVPF